MTKPQRRIYSIWLDSHANWFTCTWSHCIIPVGHNSFVTWFSAAIVIVEQVIAFCIFLCFYFNSWPGFLYYALSHAFGNKKPSSSSSSFIVSDFYSGAEFLVFSLCRLFPLQWSFSCTNNHLIPEPFPWNPHSVLFSFNVCHAAFLKPT